MTTPLLSKLYGIILEKKINIWIEIHIISIKGEIRFRSYHSIMDHIITLKIIVEEFHNNKTNLLCCFVDFKEVFHIDPKTNIWNRLEELKVPFKLRYIAISLCDCSGQI
jgi:hypothetical protein